MTLAKAIEGEPRFAEEARQGADRRRRLLDIAQKLEGLYRHASTHAAGIVIGDRPLSELVPLYRDPRSDMPATQFNMKWVEQAGLVKFDFLGLKTLTVLDTRGASSSAGAASRSTSPRMPLDDAKTYEMLSRGETVGVFQVESAGMRNALIGMKPDRIEDIIALVALYRPGPMENIPTYNARKHGEEEIASIHPKIDHPGSETHGVIVYQEQVMQIAQELAGYSLGEADLLRRAMGKKIQAEMDQQRARFVDGAVERGVAKPQADYIFDLLAKFADYGFNKIARRRLCHGLLPDRLSEGELPGRVPRRLDDARHVQHRQAGRFPPGCACGSASTWCRLRCMTVVPRLRGRRQPHLLFAGGDQGRRRRGGRAHRRRRGREAVRRPRRFLRAHRSAASSASACFESLIAAGALDCFGHDRARDDGRRRAHDGHGAARPGERSARPGRHVRQRRRRAGSRSCSLPAAEPWLPAERLHREFQAVGFYLSAHPLDEYKAALEKMRVQTWAEFSAAVKRGATAGPAGRHRHRQAGAQDAHRQQDGRRAVLRHVRPVRGGAVLRRAGAVPRPARARQVGGGHGLGRGPAGRHQPAHPDGRVARQAGQPGAEGAARLSCATPARSARSPRSSAVKGEGQVSFIVIKEGGQGEVEIAAARPLSASRRSVASAMRAVPGVVEVELVSAHSSVGRSSLQRPKV